MMLGDLLLSTPGRENSGPIPLPSRFHSKFPLKNLELSGLEQKICILSDTLAAAWAGNQTVARAILGEVRKSLNQPYSGDGILSIIEQMDINEKEKESVSFIFFAMQPRAENGETQIIIQDYLTGETTFGPNHKVKYAGSGTFHFFETLEFDIIGTIGDVNEFETTITTFLSRAAIAFYEELVSDTNHNFYYGGGFEILAPNPIKHRLEKIPFASAFWQADGRDSLRLIGPIFTNQYTVRGDLIISRIHYEEDKPKLSQFVVPSLISGNKDTNQDLPTPDFDPFIVVHYIVEKNSDVIRLAVKKGAEKNIIFTIDKDGIFTVSDTGEFIAEVLG
ncbi:MAG: hypothetical protein HQ503_03015 [Rhodospirillales bacterium]|nr:hypothetical protein [Rhodospirillales bacterium]